MPIAGTVSIEVAADSPEEALEEFYKKCEEFELVPNDDEFETEWSFYEKLFEGNVCYVWDDEVTITKGEEE
jgi:hypothetical protein